MDRLQVLGGIVERYTRFMGWAGLKPPNARFGYNTLRPFLIGRTGFAHTVVSTDSFLTLSTLQHQRRSVSPQDPSISRRLEAQTCIPYLACQLPLSKATNMSAESADKNVQTDHVQVCVAIPVRRREATVETLIH